MYPFTQQLYINVMSLHGAISLFVPCVFYPSCCRLQVTANELSVHNYIISCREVQFLIGVLRLPLHTTCVNLSQELITVQCS